MPNTQIPIKRQIFRALEAKSLRNRPFATRLADYLTNLTSTPLFLFTNGFGFAAWIGYNSGLIPGIVPFDPYPFGLLTMGVSLEAIFLSIFVLVSQGRSSQIATLRDEVNLRINLISEREITKLLKILAEIRAHIGIKEEDPELDRMIQEIKASELEQTITSQLARADQPFFRSLTKRDIPELINTLVLPKKKR